MLVSSQAMEHKSMKSKGVGGRGSDGKNESFRLSAVAGMEAAAVAEVEAEEVAVVEAVAVTRLGSRKFVYINSHTN